jgi:hypothetical protein
MCVYEVRVYSYVYIDYVGYVCVHIYECMCAQVCICVCVCKVYSVEHTFKVVCGLSFRKSIVTIHNMTLQYKAGQMPICNRT